ncbi:DNA-binding GntR family transcriptional regulator [Leucobacter luti]|uniref:GntR family transcriptional regulator n=1 Tax=Leucobacter luti TaxID=340320 RepID=UPI00104CCA23|nr:GntR family transcriptional regulator [Leucobacter luti]MCW2289568.1 DNA-binding GntR family transcriptional regulator [Leucobacter luti]TCK37740.1 DNA-binding GntR family transcriptional regulator [Leucobacter luti]
MPIPGTKTTTAARRVLLRDVVEDRLREAIMDGTLEPGETLHDKELQDWLGVSRTPIRDALNELARTGLVEMEPNRYTRVVVPREEEALEAMQTLGVLLGGIVRLAVPRLDKKSRTRIIADLSHIQEDLEASSLAQTRNTVLKMWERLAQQCGNAILQGVYQDAMTGLFFKVPVEFFARLFDQDEIRTELVKLSSAIESRDAIAAELATERIYQLPAADAAPQ